MDPVTELVAQRDEWRSVRSGTIITGVPFNCHHRQLRSQGGSDAPGNRVTLSGSGTMLDHGWVHSHVTLSQKAGWLVESWRNPLEVPVWLWSKGWCLLNDDGGLVPLEDQPPQPEGLPS